MLTVNCKKRTKLEPTTKVRKEHKRKALIVIILMDAYFGQT